MRGVPWRRVFACAVVCLVLAAGARRAAGAEPAAAATPAAPAVPPNVYLYDLGTDTSPVWAGFARVTAASAYDAKLGYGWLSKPEELVSWCGEYLDALAIDGVSGRLNLTAQFRQDLPNGRYTVWVLTGSLVSLDYLLRPHTLLVQGKEALKIQPAQDEVFRSVRYEWSKGDSIYEQFVQPRFWWLQVEAEVTAGQLTLGFGNARDFPVCALVIAANAVAKRTAEEIDRLNTLRQAAFYDIWQEVRPEFGSYDSASTEERLRGYMVAPVNGLDDILPGSAPSPEATGARLDVFGTPGEQRQASFCVYGLTDLRQVSFSVTDLKTADGQTLPATAIECGLVQFAPRRLGHGPKYDLFPVLILPLRPTSVGDGTCKQFWLTLHLPENAAAGVYDGKVTVTALDAPATALPLRVRVLPFKLLTPPVEHYFYFGTMIWHARVLMPEFDETKYWASVRAETRFLKQNEFCIANCLPNYWGNPRVTKRDGRIVDVDLSPTAKLMEIVKDEQAWPRDNTMIFLAEYLNNECGGYWRESGPQRGLKFAPTAEDRANFIDAVRLVNEKAKKAGWPEIVFEAGGEYTNYGENGTEFGLAIHQAFKDAGVANALRGNGPSDMNVIRAGLVDFPQPNWAMMRAEDLRFMRANSKRLWAYNFSTGRFGYGWFCFKHGITRASYEAGIYFQRQPGNIFDDVYGDFPMGLPTSLTTLAPTVQLKRIVDGAIDYKYLYTLARLCRDAEATGRKTSAQAARAYLETRLKSIPEGTEDLKGLVDQYNEVREGVSWHNGDFDKYRWQVAEFILALRQELERKQP